MRLAAGKGQGTKARVTLAGQGAILGADADISPAKRPWRSAWRNPSLWSCESPNLYELDITLLRGDAAFDSYALPVGIRTVEVRGDSLLLNGAPILLKGFGRHEDFPVTGNAASSRP